jgi:hypothetical protein
MEKRLKVVEGPIEFRDAVMTLDREGCQIYARQHGFTGPTYRILARLTDPFEKITVGDLFGSHYAPVYMEDFAQALVAVGEDVPKVDVFVLGDID